MNSSIMGWGVSFERERMVMVLLFMLVGVGGM